jgi:hypothetical protein
MYIRDYILQEKESEANQQRCGWGFISKIFVITMNWLCKVCIEYVINQTFRLYIPRIMSVESLLLACCSPVARPFLVCFIWLGGFSCMSVKAGDASSVFEKFNDRRLAVPWYTGLSPPRMETLQTTRRYS